MRPVRVLIVEDEPLARGTLRGLVEGTDDLELIGEAADGPAAARLIDEHLPDLVFLDVELPGISGLKVLERARHAPAVVFTTAYDRYAVAAFELEAVDYLVKPFGRRRFRETLARIRRRLEAESLRPGLPSITWPPVRGPLRRLFARVGDRVVPIAVDRISRAEAQGDYVAIHHEGREHLLHVSLGDLEERLDPERFLRIHRSHLVNLDDVRELTRYDERRLSVRLKDGTTLVASRAGSRKLRELIS